MEDSREFQTAQRFAGYLRRSGITISPEESDNHYDFTLYHADGAGSLVEIAELRYDRRGCRFSPASSDELARRKRIPGLRDAMKDFSYLLQASEGNFYDDMFDPVHDALDELE